MKKHRHETTKIHEQAKQTKNNSQKNKKKQNQ